MDRRPAQSPDKLFVLIIILIVVDLLTTGSMNWSKWPIIILLCVYFLSFLREEDRGSRELTILRERFAKGDLSEEEFLRKKELIEDYFAPERSSGFLYFVGIFLMFIGFFLISSTYLHYSVPLLPVILIIVGLFSIFRNFR